MENMMRWIFCDPVYCCTAQVLYWSATQMIGEWLVGDMTGPLQLLRSVAFTFWLTLCFGTKSPSHWHLKTLRISSSSSPLVLQLYKQMKNHYYFTCMVLQHLLLHLLSALWKYDFAVCIRGWQVTGCLLCWEFSQWSLIKLVTERLWCNQQHAWTYAWPR